MKNTKTTVLLSALSLFSTPTIMPKEESHANSTQKNKIESVIKDEVVCISGKDVMESSDAGQALQTKLQAAQEEASKPLQSEAKKVEQKQQELQKQQEIILKKQQELQAKKDSLDSDVAAFEKVASSLSEDARNKKMEPLQAQGQELMDEKRKFDRMVQSFEDEGIEFGRMQQKLKADAEKINAKMQGMYQKEMGAFDALLKETIQEVAQREGWYLVLMQEALIYSHPSKSKTDIIIAELNKKTKAINLAKKQSIEKNSAPKKDASASKSKSEENVKSYG